MDDKAAFGFYPQLKPKRTTQDPEAAKNAPVDFLRGRVAGTLGMPGDIEQLARDLAMLAGAPESQSFLPTTERVLPNIPLGSDTPVSRAAAGLGSLTSNPIDVVKAGKLAGKAAKAAKPEVGQALEEYMFKQGLALPATVYHGSPHKFDKFDSSKIGTGEGAQAYGHGLYLAESPGVAKYYSKNVQDSRGFWKSTPEDELDESLSSELTKWIQGGGDIPTKTGFKDYLKYIYEADRNPNIKNALKRVDQRFADGTIVLNPKGQLYKVDLPDEQIAKMLDWDKPLSEQPWVMNRIKPMLEDSNISPEKIPFLTGKDLMSVDGPMAAWFGKTRTPSMFSEGLRQEGIPGIRYLDGGSRGTGAGTSNFVVFPGQENALTILERNGQPIKKESTRLADNPDTMMMEVEDKKFGIGGMAGKAIKSAVATRELEKQAVLRAEAAAKSAAKQALMPQYNEAVKGMTQKQDPLSFEQWKAINYPEGTQGLQNVPQKQTFKYPQEEAMRLAQQRAALPIEQGGLGLPANNTPEQRAKAMSWKTPSYHGTHTDVPVFDSKKNITAVDFYSSPNPTEAGTYAEGIGGNVMPLMLRGEIKDLTNDSRYLDNQLRKAYNSQYSKYEREYYPFEQFKNSFLNGQLYQDTGGQSSQNALVKELIGTKKSILKIPDAVSGGGVGESYVVTNPENIRSRFAAFDPWRKTAATAAAMGVAAPDLLAEEKKAAGGAVFNTDPDMSDGGQIFQGPPFKHGGDVNLDAMYMAVNDAKFRRK